MIGRGPSLRAFLLLAALQIAWFLCCVIDSLMACCAIHIILPRCCKQWLQCERSLHWWFLIWLGLLLHAQLELSLHHLLPYWLSANSHVSWRRVLRTPPHLPFLGRGVPQVGLEKWQARGSTSPSGGNLVDGLPPAPVRDWLGASCSSDRSPAQTCYRGSTAGCASWDEQHGKLEALRVLRRK